MPNLSIMAPWEVGTKRCKQCGRGTAELQVRGLAPLQESPNV